MQGMLRTAAVLGTVAFFSGCATSGAFPAGHLTNVEVAESNFRVIATNVVGTASAGYVLGASGGVGGQVSTFALARVSGEGQLYGAALRDLWANFEAEHGSADGRSLALTNVRFDSDALNLLVYTQATVWVRADVVEFSP